MCCPLWVVLPDPFHLLPFPPHPDPSTRISTRAFSACLPIQHRPSTPHFYAKNATLKFCNSLLGNLNSCSPNKCVDIQGSIAVVSYHHDLRTPVVLELMTQEYTGQKCQCLNLTVTVSRRCPPTYIASRCSQPARFNVGRSIAH